MKRHKEVNAQNSRQTDDGREEDLGVRGKLALTGGIMLRDRLDLLHQVLLGIGAQRNDHRLGIGLVSTSPPSNDGWDTKQVCLPYDQDIFNL